jgi:hypothetical protein
MRCQRGLAFLGGNSFVKIHTLRPAVLAVALALGLSVQVFAKEHFYRIIQGPNPGPKQAEIDRYLYGSEVLYTGDAQEQPTRVEGTVWHSDLSEARYFVGTRNPVIQQRQLMELISNDKWEEAKLLMKYVPDAFPKTENLAELLRQLGLDPAASALPRPQLLVRISQALRERFPQGFFLKPVAGFNSAGTFPTEKSDFASIYEAYMADVKPVIQRRMAETGGDATVVHLELKAMPNYSGRVLEDLLDHPEKVIIQQKLRPAFGSIVQTPEGPKPLILEYRVHVVEGKVLVGGTQTRWEDARSVSPEAFARVEAFAQRVVNQLPPSMRKMCFAMDVMQTENGLYKVIELNAGGDSGYLYPDIDLWVAQLLAAHYQEGHTPLLDEFERFKHASTLDAKEAALERLLKRHELAKLKTELAPVTELLAQAKEVLLSDVRNNPSGDTAFDAIYVLKKFKLEPYLTAADIEMLANLMGGVSPLHPPLSIDPVAWRSEMLGLGEGEILFVGTEGQIRFVNGMSYDDAAVEGALLEQLDTRSLDMHRVESLRKQADQLARERVATRAELALGQVAREELARDLGKATEGARLFYSGSREALVRNLIEALLKRR